MVRKRTAETMAETTQEAPAAKRLKKSDATTSRVAAPPCTFVTWNCNGFISRCKYNNVELKRLVQETESPHVICIQEVRLKASSSNNRGTPLQSEYDLVKETLSTTFHEYTPYWSLSEKRYAGTLTLLHHKCCPGLVVDGTKSSTIVTAFTPESAIEALLGHYTLTREQVGLPPIVVKAKKKGVTMKSFFAPLKNKDATVSSCNGPQHHHHRPQEHNEDGRFQYFIFSDSDFELLQTYVPNNGTKDESFQRRKQWDEEMLQFLQHRGQILKRVGATLNKKFLWCGDMNCAHDYRDGTHWIEQSTQSNNPTIYEWWTDESKCFVKKPGAQANHKKKAPMNIGMPSFTPGERLRFSQLIKEGNLVDVWRDLHPNGSNGISTCCAAAETNISKWDRPNYTWRGHLGVNNGSSKYEGKGQRLDYFLASPSLRWERCDILGYGSQRKGLFCGSDHCASILVLKD